MGFTNVEQECRAALGADGAPAGHHPQQGCSLRSYMWWNSCDMWHWSHSHGSSRALLFGLPSGVPTSALGAVCSHTGVPASISALGGRFPIAAEQKYIKIDELSRVVVEAQRTAKVTSAQ